MKWILQSILLIQIWRTAVQSVLEESMIPKNCFPFGCEGNLANHLCSCDDECFKFGECCADRALRNNQSRQDFSEIKIHEIPRKRWSCEKLEPPFHTTVVWSVAKCPSDAGGFLAEKCELEDISSPRYHYTMDVRVLSETTGIWYRNIYCAICNGEQHSLAKLNYSISCENPNITQEQALQVVKDGKYVEPLTWEHSVLQQERNRCFLRTKPAADIPQQYLRKCGGFVISPKSSIFVAPLQDCADGWDDHNVEELCKAYALYSKVRSTDTIENSAFDSIVPQVYKNPHCAICNGVPVSDLQCLLPNIRKQSIHPPSLKIIMNFMEWEDSSDRPKSCRPPTGIWDGLHNKCIELVQMKQEDSFVESDKSFNISCPTIMLKKSEYQMLENRSLQFMGENSYYSGYIFSNYMLNKDGSVVVCAPSDEESLKFISGTSQEYLTAFCLSLSVICLILHVATYCALPKLCNLPGKNLLSLSWALLVAQLILLILVRPPFEVPYGVCVGIAVVEHYCFLAAFLWMNVMSVDIWRTFSESTVRSTGGIKTHRKYAAYAWGISAIIAIAAVTVDLCTEAGVVKPFFGRNQLCWFGNGGGLGIFLALPMFLLLTVNLMLFISTVHKIWQTKRQGVRYIHDKARTELIRTSEKSSTQPKTSIKSYNSNATISGRKEQARCYLYLKLFTIMGLTWIFGFIAMFTSISLLWYPFIIFNGLQGCFIFVMFDVKRNIVLMLWDKYITKHGYQPPGFLTNSTSGTKTTSDSSSKSRTTSTLTLNGRNSSTATRTLSASSNSVLTSSH